MNEEFLHYVWKYQLLSKPIRISNLEEAKVINPGQYNCNSGPDFFNARIQLGSTIWAGNIEIHIKASDWYKHEHQFDSAYDSILLHVVLINDKDVYRLNGDKIPSLELEKYISKSLLKKYHELKNSLQDISCHETIGSINRINRINWFDNLMAERLESRSLLLFENVRNSVGDFQEVLYQRIFRSLGQTVNADSFEMLARITPLKLLLKYSDRLDLIEAFLYGQAGLLPDKSNDQYVIKLKNEYNYLKKKHHLVSMKNHQWKFMRMRPSGFPTIRISQIANLLYKIKFDLINLFDHEMIDELEYFLNARANSYWNNHYRFGVPTKGKEKNIGKESTDMIIINSIIPAMFYYGKLQNNHYQEKALSWISKLPAEKNRITRKFKNLGILAENASESQAMIELYKNYCLPKRCIDCKFGHILLNK